MQGIAYGVGVGPGDPELMTIKAVRLIRESEVIAFPARAAGESTAFPARAAEESTAFRIAAKVVPEIRNKTLLPIFMPMVRDRLKMAEEHQKGAKILEEYLEKGQNIIFLTLGDPTVYCSFSYLQHILEEDGYEVRLVSGVTSFCAAAAKVQIPLAEGEEPVMITAGEYRDFDGTLIIMKAGKNLKKLKEEIKACGKKACLAENCGMAGERRAGSTGGSTTACRRRTPGIEAFRSTGGIGFASTADAAQPLSPL